MALTTSHIVKRALDNPYLEGFVRGFAGMSVFLTGIALDVQTGSGVIIGLLGGLILSDLVGDKFHAPEHCEKKICAGLLIGLALSFAGFYLSGLI